MVLLLWPWLCMAEGEPGESPDEWSLFGWLDKPRDYLSEQFVSLSEGIDGFFADERVFQESRGSYLRLHGDLVQQEGESSNLKFKLRAKLVLPALEQRLKLLIESDDEAAQGGPASVLSTQRGVPGVDLPEDYRAALQALLTESTHWNINTDLGVRIRTPLEPFARVRARRVQDVDQWQFRFTETLFWFEQQGAGESTQFDADRKLGDKHLARSRTVATWRDREQRFDFEQGFYLFHRVSGRDAISYQANVFGLSKPNAHVSGYAVSAKWRRRVHHEWLFLEVQPLLSWPEEQAFRSTPSILFRIEAIFGDVACGCYGL